MSRVYNDIIVINEYLIILYLFIGPPNKIQRISESWNDSYEQYEYLKDVSEDSLGLDIGQFLTVEVIDEVPEEVTDGITDEVTTPAVQSEEIPTRPRRRISPAMPLSGLAVQATELQKESLQLQKNTNELLSQIIKQNSEIIALLKKQNN